MDKNNIQAELDKIKQAIIAQEALKGTLTDDQLTTALTPLRQKQVELTAQLASMPVSGRDATIVGQGSKSVGERAVLVEGNVSGNIITGDQSKVGGIQAKTIKAENVVQGMQQIGGDLSNATDAIALAEALSNGRITADSIEAQNVVTGLQYIANPATATAGELQQEVAALKQQLADAIAAGEIENSGDMEDVQNALTTAETELAKEAPQGDRIVRKLKEATTLLTEGSKVADAARQTGMALIKLAPVAAALYQISTNLFAG